MSATQSDVCVSTAEPGSLMKTPTTDAIASGADEASMFTPSSTKPEVVTLQAMIEAYLQEYEVRQFRINIARCRLAHLRAWGGLPSHRYHGVSHPTVPSRSTPAGCGDRHGQPRDLRAHTTVSDCH